MVGLNDMEHFSVAAELVQVEVVLSSNLAGVAVAVAVVVVEAVEKIHY